MKTMWNKISICLVLCLVWNACVPDATDVDMDVIMRKVNEEINNNRSLREYDCSNQILSDAEAFVDSIMSDTLNFNLGKGINFPNRPIRPKHVGYIQLDNTQIKPFIEKKQPKDSIK